MSYAPKTISDLAAYWSAQGGVNLGIVGNTAHTSGYHLGKDRIYDGAGPGIGDRDYSVQLPRDKAGLTNAAAALDLGKLNGSITQLRKFSEWLVAQALAGKCRDVREIIYSTSDGVYVKRWSGPDNKVYTSLRKNADGSITTITPGNGDASHYSHTHISFYRDSEGRDKTALFAPYFATAPAPSEDEIMKPYPVPSVPTIGFVATDVWLYDNSSCLPSPGNIQVDPGRDMPYLGQPSTTYRIVEYVDAKGVHSGKAMFIKAPDLTNIRPAPDATPFDQGDIDAATAKADKKIADAVAVLTAEE